MTALRVVLVDINPKMIAAWRSTFEENPEVEIVAGSMLDQRVDAWVTPTNSHARMDGGLDGVIKNHLGAGIEARVQAEIRRVFGARLDVGQATCVPTGVSRPKFLISTPTMGMASEDISDSLNVALACAAAFRAVAWQNLRAPDSITSVALPGLGANTGRVPVAICADLMWTSYHLFRHRPWADFEAMRAALEAELGDLGLTPAKPQPSATVAAPASKGIPPKAPAGKSTTPTPSSKATDVDFDDF